jgi:hypothetical protein
MIPRYTCENKPQNALNQQNPASYQSMLFISSQISPQWRVVNSGLTSLHEGTVISSIIRILLQQWIQIYFILGNRNNTGTICYRRN